MSYDDLHQALFLYSLTLPRLMACFIFLPILSKQMLGGAMIRNGVLCSLALFIFPVVNEQALPAETDGLWLIVILGKEVLLGMLIGFVAAIPFWAIEATGFLVDNQRGAAMASMFNPTLGSQSTPTAVLLTQTLITLFFSGGGFVAFIYALFKSYTTWPILGFFPMVTGAWVSFFYAQFQQLMWLGVLMSAPLVLAMFLAEFGLALISRFAPQLNVFFLAMPIKSAIASVLLIVYLGLMMDHFEALFYGITRFGDQLNTIWK
ncbi:SctT family type III secretion system export apparatus subunit VscT [Vibrio parahaemolyticus]|uniref:SctT family type III secretion system export apparatus subunit VscT n=1 Tax=Vibrio parahaemolyticus TaxID=670 RepID=UPI00111D87D0|nr:SctT family type III secretion system export apparatus subunit VscT [Vibrio parahaemolyticus]MBE3784421.1 SctT family type III secretion system export apparatus subunit VscT [Vibrio parahaemolyticus]MDF4991840.1 SctT family type III secretion system export apparatus subunit VscT [Vibrio parahaemolyticus]TOB57656.1 EscT/YscT/HrcT family type III secretion system export apparatus protein [Vibrio parahaemolyticus]HCG7298675.1 SctT family type III secretion system export apparatus subunit VscT [